MNRIILQSTLKDDLVLEPFAGTGSFCASAKYLGRNYIGFEKDRSYQKIANKRLKSIKSLDHKLLDLNEKDKTLLKEFKTPKPAREISLIYHKTQLKIQLIEALKNTIDGVVRGARWGVGCALV